MNLIRKIISNYPFFKNAIKKIIFFLKGFISYFLIRFFEKKITYKYLFNVSYFSKKKFKKLKEKIIKSNLNSLKLKGKINLGFVVYTGSMWFLDKLLHSLQKDERFDINIIVGEFEINNPTASKETFSKAKKYFSEKYGNRVIVVEKNFSVEKYDILFYLTPYDFVEPKINSLNVSLSKFLCYVSYSYMLAENTKKINLPLYMLSWKFFCDSAFYVNMVKKYIHVDTDNQIYCGYPKMDDFYTSKTVFKKTNKKIIIYAPHQSVNYKGSKSATFDINYKLLFEIAKKYADTTYWFIKPHPLLRANSVTAGIFKNVEEYDDYINSWNSLVNAEAVFDGNYIDIFKQSDAMITDSVSFLAEYQFTGKPLLLLESGKQLYNDFGNELLKILYRCKPDDSKAIEAFIDKVLDDKDSMKNIRKEFFDKHLNYYAKSGKLANDNIYSVFKNSLEFIGNYK